jgi:hypothetical protein
MSGYILSFCAVCAGAAYYYFSTKVKDKVIKTNIMKEKYQNEVVNKSYFKHINLKSYHINTMISDGFKFDDKGNICEIPSEWKIIHSPIVNDWECINHGMIGFDDCSEYGNTLHCYIIDSNSILRYHFITCIRLDIDSDACNYNSCRCKITPNLKLVDNDNGIIIDAHEHIQDINYCLSYICNYHEYDFQFPLNINYLIKLNEQEYITQSSKEFDELKKTIEELNKYIKINHAKQHEEEIINKYSQLAIKNENNNDSA